MIQRRRQVKNQRSKYSFLLGLISLAVVFCVHFAEVQIAFAQPPSGNGRFQTSILDEEPFDILTLTGEWKNKEFKVFPFTFPGRKVPQSPDPESEIDVRLNLYPDRKYKIAWKDVGKIEFYEELVLAEANRLVTERKFAPAFEHLIFLINNYPQTPGLEKLRQDFLLASALDMIKSGNLAHALAVLEEFQRSYPNDKKAEQVRTKISQLANDLIAKYFENDELATARRMVTRLERDYKSSPIPTVAKWKAKFREYAETFRKKAIVLKEEGNYPDARATATRMLEIEPDLPGGKKLLQEIVTEYPMVRVGVFQQPHRMDAAEIADWPVRRAGSLVTQSLFEFRNTGPEGGNYRFTYGSFIHSDDRTELEIKIQSTNQPYVPSAYEISQWMYRRSDANSPEYFPAWAAIVKQISVNSPESMLVKLKRPHVLPHAFLQWPMELLASDENSSGALYSRSEDRGGNRHSYRWKSKTKAANLQPVEIIETAYTDPKKAVADLMKGDIEIIDRLFPADASLLKGIRDIKVESYALPMVHMLVPVSKHPYLVDRDFRRTLLYAVNRQAILEGEILGGTNPPDSKLISGPFPLGEGENDPLSYAYNKAITPIPYDPRLAKLLAMLTQKKLAVAAEKKKEPPPVLTPLRLGVPDYESARVAGQACVQQWAIVGIPAELVVLQPGDREKSDTQIDLLYVSAALWEPATDAERLLGEGGIAETDNIFIVQVLANLRTAKNWREVRQYCQDLHRLVNDHLPVLPLWQVGESFAYRTMLQGMPKRPVVLYQDIQKWRMNLTPP